MVTILEPTIRYWRCPACDGVDRTERTDCHLHACPALNGLTVPYVEVQNPDDDPRARQVVVQSEFGYETSSVRTERMDGSNDVTVFPQPAVGSISY